MPAHRRWLVADDEDYIDRDAVVRMPKGERLADSKKTEGWSRGFTPNSPDKGPEHVEIRLKDVGEDDRTDPILRSSTSTNTSSHPDRQSRHCWRCSPPSSCTRASTFWSKRRNPTSSNGETQRPSLP